MSESITEFIADLKLGEKTLPYRNPGVAWVWVFFPAAVAYLVLLMQILNAKPILGSIEVYDASFEKIAATKYPMQVIVTENEFTEGPLWIDNDDNSPFLLYSDLKQNKIFRWEEGKGFFTVGKTLFIDKSGCKLEDMAYCNALLLPGSNAISRVHPAKDMTSMDDLVVCQHGERAVMLQRGNGTRTAIATHYKGKRFNSPNDIAFSAEGHLYFTDPIYGLYTKSASAAKGRELDEALQEQPHSGLYMIHASEVNKARETGVPAANVFLIDAKMSHPNGLAFSPGYSKLYVSNSDETNAYWKVYEVNPKGLATKGKIFYNVTDQYESNKLGGHELFGVPDGLKVDQNGNLFATGPGGVLVLSPEAQLLGRLRTDRAVTNVAFATDGYLYLTAQDLVLRKWLSTRGAKPPITKS